MTTATKASTTTTTTATATSAATPTPTETRTMDFFVILDDLRNGRFGFNPPLNCRLLTHTHTHSHSLFRLSALSLLVFHSYTHARTHTHFPSFSHFVVSSFCVCLPFSRISTELRQNEKTPPIDAPVTSYQHFCKVLFLPPLRQVSRNNFADSIVVSSSNVSCFSANLAENLKLNRDTFTETCTEPLQLVGPSSCFD